MNAEVIEGIAQEEKAEEEEKTEQPAAQEVIQGYRRIKLPDNSYVRIFRVAPGLEEAADKIYDLRRRQLLLESNEDERLLSDRQMRRILQEMGDWAEEDDTRLEGLGKILQDAVSERVRLQKELDTLDKHASKKAKQRKLDQAREKEREARKAHGDLASIREDLFSGTIERHADMARRAFLYVNTVFKDNDDREPYWPDVDSFRGDVDSDAIIVIVSQAHLAWAGLNTEDLEGFLEV